jgi:hypothetical protein
VTLRSMWVLTGSHSRHNRVAYFGRSNKTKNCKLGLDLNLQSGKKMRTQSLISASLFDCIGQATSPRDQLESSSKNPQTHPEASSSQSLKESGEGEFS